MKAKFTVVTLAVVLSMWLTLFVPIVVSAPTIMLPGNVTASQTYLDTLTYYFKCCFPNDWENQLTQALNAPPLVDRVKQGGKMVPNSASDPQSTHVILTGVPANGWWIDAYRLELNGTWNKVFGHSFKPAGKAPGPVDGDLMLQGTLPEAYVIRVCERAGAVVAGPKLLVIKWSGGAAQTFNVPALPDATADQLAGIKM
jgi:hypothetical protein